MGEIDEIAAERDREMEEQDTTCILCYNISH